MQNERYYVVGQIETAFFELLREKDYTDITVTDIIKKAQVSRGSRTVFCRIRTYRSRRSTGSPPGTA